MSIQSISRGIDVAGAEDAPPIVLLHAASYTRRTWLLPMRILARTHRVYAIDLPGHGECPIRKFDYDDALDMLGGFLQERVGRPALLAGISLGGCLAMELAPRHPDLVAGLALSGSTFDARGKVCHLVLTGESIVFPRWEKRLIRKLHRFANNSLPADAAEAIIEGGSWWHAAADAVKQLRGRDFPASLRRFDGPVLILNGDRDFVHRTAERAFARVCKDVRVETIRGGHHVCSLNDPAAYADAVRRFAEEMVYIQAKTRLQP